MKCYQIIINKYFYIKTLFYCDDNNDDNDENKTEQAEAELVPV